MSISQNVGGMSRYLDGIRTADAYTNLKKGLEKAIRKIPSGGDQILIHLRKTKSSIKQLFVPGMFFEDMGITYLGPVDGHNLKELIRAFREAKKVKGNGDIITKEISVRDYSAIKVGSTAMGYSDSWFSLFSRGGNPSYVFGYTQGESASLRITIDENLYPYINVQVKNEELSISTENGTQLSPTRFKIEGTSKKLEKSKMSGCMDFVLRSALSEMIWKL